MKYCTQCGARQADVRSNFCSSCGEPIGKELPTEESSIHKSQLAIEHAVNHTPKIKRWFSEGKMSSGDSFLGGVGLFLIFGSVSGIIPILTEEGIPTSDLYVAIALGVLGLALVLLALQHRVPIENTSEKNTKNDFK